MGKKSKYRPKKKKAEFSKLIFIVISITTIAVVVFFMPNDLYHR